jgi:hypothetical protein
LQPGDGVLDRGVSAVRADAYAWFSQHAPNPPFPDDDRRHWRICKRAAETTAAELTVSIGQLDADINVLLVEGSWSQRPAAGLAFCSLSLKADDNQLYALLRKTFAASVL